jgi:hypothetical protein
MPNNEAQLYFVSNRARNSAHVICRSLGFNELKSVPESEPLDHIPQDAEAVEDASDNSSDSDNPADEPADLRELEVFIVTSRAFEMLKLNVRHFIFP